MNAGHLVAEGIALAAVSVICCGAVAAAAEQAGPTASGAVTAVDDEAAIELLPEIDLPGTEDPELVEIAGAVLDEHGMVIPERRLSCSQWEAYEAALEHKVADQPSAFACWLLATVSMQCAGST